MIHRIALLICTLLLYSAAITHAQHTRLYIRKVDSLSGALVGKDKKPIPVFQQYDNQMDAYAAARKLVPQLRDLGYLAAALDTVIVTDSFVEAHIYQGDKYQWAKLSFDSIPVEILDAMNLRLRDWEQIEISPGRLAALSETMLNYCENNGYPFASTTLKNIESDEKGITAQFILNRGDLIHFDSLAIESNVDISRDYLQNYLGIHQGDVYNEGQLRLVEKRLSELAFLQPDKAWRMEFTIAKNTLYLYLKEKKSNQLNGLIGLQPNTVQTGKFLLTADILLGLKNALGHGETIAATYQNLQYKSPRFHLEAGMPYLFGTQIGVDGSFDLFKKDTTFYRTTFEGGLRYQFNASDFLKIGYQAYSNHLITADTNYVIANKKLPDNMDLSTRGAVATFSMDRTDYKLSPRKGWQLQFTGSGLIRHVKENDEVTGITDGSGYDYSHLYDSVNSEKYQYRFVVAANYFMSPLKNFVILVSYHGGYISGHNLFLNELYQLGGFKLLRGFDEQSIYASQYHVGTIEMRFLLSRNSYFYLFNDDAIIQADYSGVLRKDNPVSFGGGITLENKTGIFNVGIGLGKTSGTDFSFKQARIQFGYTAYF
jgi:outer membrane protein assembly factor BamA